MTSRVKRALPYPICHLKGTNSHSKSEGYQLGNEFQLRRRIVQSRNHSCCLSTHLAVVQDHDPAAAHHRVQTMGDDEGGAAAKRAANGLLNEKICLRVDGGCCFVQYQNLKQMKNRKQTH